MEWGANQGDWKKKIGDAGKLRGFSPKTIRSYIHHVKHFIDSGLDPESYILGLVDKGKKVETVRLAGFSVKFYLKIMGLKDKIAFPNLKREKKLPVILSRKEIDQMVLVTQNVAHRLIIQMAYATGMRVSELVNLKWDSIDFGRNLIHIKRGKGKKDRVVMLSSRLKKGLKSLGLEREGSVFVSNRNKKYSIRTIEKIVGNAAKKANLSKNVTPHTLRHSFATHLLERGTDIRYIKDLLGHADISTTLIYTYVSKKDISRIKSPLDE